MAGQAGRVVAGKEGRVTAWRFALLFGVTCVGLAMWTIRRMGRWEP